MKAAVCTRYGPPQVLQIQSVERPPPKRGEVLVKVAATAVTSSDCFIRSGIPTAKPLARLLFRLFIGLRKPRRPILGLVLSGEIAAVGKHVSRFRAGDRVYAFTGFRFGAYGEYATLPESGIIATVPSNFAVEEAAAIP